jgi:hypothetical protein
MSVSTPILTMSSEICAFAEVPDPRERDDRRDRGCR